MKPKAPATGMPAALRAEGHALVVKARRSGDPGGPEVSELWLWLETQRLDGLCRIEVFFDEGDFGHDLDTIAGVIDEAR